MVRHALRIPEAVVRYDISQLSAISDEQAALVRASLRIAPSGTRRMTLLHQNLNMTALRQTTLNTRISNPTILTQHVTHHSARVQQHFERNTTLLQQNLVYGIRR